MKKSFIFMVLLLIFPITSFASETKAVEGKVIAAEFFEEAFDKMHSPVLLKYTARENNCDLIENESSVSIVDKNGKVIKTYRDVVYLNDEPVADAVVLGRDLGWTSCRHLPNTDMFTNDAAAIIAGGITYYNGEGETVYYVGNCFYGSYFSGSAGEHTSKCSHTSNASMFYEYSVTITDVAPEDTEESTDNVVAEIETPASSAMFHKDLHPVMLRYILLKNGYKYSYNSEDDTILTYAGGGELVAGFKNVPLLYNSFTVDTAAISRVPELKVPEHEPDTDLFYTEKDAMLAGWLTYFPNSENMKFTYYVGNCYGGYYFSPVSGRHASGCDHTLNVSMFYEIPVIIENGTLTHDGEVIADINGDEFAEYDRASGKVTVEKPISSMTKMVTVIHSEYAKEDGVQTAYFSYRDRVYRNYWEDLANYDVTDYIFIPPDLPILEAGSYGDFNSEEAIKVADAVKRLLSFKSDAKIWVGTTGITSANFSHSAISDAVVSDFLDKVRKRLGADTWEKNVEGIYVNQESIYTEETKLQADRIKRIVSRFKEKNPEKKSLWIPYYDLAADSSSIAERIAELSRTPDLFDYIIIQPGYFFFEKTGDVLDPATTSHRKQNLEAVKFSAENSYVSNALGSPVDGKASNAIIGFEMEPQASYFSTSRDTRGESIDRYTSYLLAGAKIKDIGPVAFYTSGDPHCNKEILVYKFYGADELGETVVRKRLEDNLDKFYGYVFETRENDKVFMEYAKSLYLRSNPQKTEEDFMGAYNASLIIPLFYEYEQARNLSSLAAYIESGGEIPGWFDIAILNLLGEA